MSKKRNLFVCYVRQKSNPISSEKAVYCYAFSHRHALNLAIKFCIYSYYWELDNFDVSEPILITNFTR